VVDWDAYRAVVEREATRLTGLETQIKGAIDVRLLPAPRLALNDITIGGVPARALTVELSLGALMRGEWRATDLGIAAPRVTLAFDQDGRVSLPSPQPGFDGGAVAVERLHIEDARLAVIDRDGKPLSMLDALWFTGDARTLAGPYRGEGAFTKEGALYPYRLSVGRPDDGKSRVRLNIDPTERPISLEADGEVSFANGVPRFEGAASVARPVQLVSAKLTPPWRLSSKVKASSASVLLDQIEFLYGQEDQGVKLTGTADVKFAPQPRIEGVLSARQIDLDRALADATGARPAPAAALRTLAEAAAGALPFPFRLGIGIDSVTLGGGALAAVRGDIESASDGWRLSGFEFRAPGFSRVQLAGSLATLGRSVAFNGRAGIDASDLKALVAWLEGRSAAPGPARALKAQGDVTLGSERLAVERLRAEFDRETVEGRVAYVFAAAGQPAKLDAELRASELDLDGAQSFLQAIAAGSAAERPQDIALTLDLARATISGVPARELHAKIRSDAAGIAVERLTAGDIGGAAINAGGRIALTPAPRGTLTADLDARDIASVATLLARYWPAAAPQLRQLKGASKLRAALDLGGATPGALSLNGNAGTLRVALNAQAGAALTAFDMAQFETLNGRFDLRLDADDSNALIALLGLNTVMVSGAQPGQFTLASRGRWRGDWTLDAKLSGGSLDLAANGTASPFAEKPVANVALIIKNADLRPLLQSASPAPLTLSGKLALAGDNVALTDASASFGGANLRGRLLLAGMSPRRIDGDIAADNLNAVPLLAAASGFPNSNTTEQWPIDPFRPGVAAGYQGRVVLRSARATLTPTIAARDLAASVVFSGDGVTFESVSGEVGGGRMTGTISLRRGSNGLALSSDLTVDGADATALYPSGARPAITGKVSLAANVTGAGLSPSALVGSLNGSGKVSLIGGKFASLDPRVFGNVTQAVDRGLPVDGIRIRDAAVRALDGGDLTVRRADAALQIANGQLRLQDASIEADGGALTTTGTIDLTQATLDARLVFGGTANATANGGRPDIFVALRGPWTAPTRTVDVSAFVGWLTVRAIDQQARKLEAIERGQPAQSAPASLPEQGPAASVPPPRPATPRPVQPRPPQQPRPAPSAPLQLTPPS
jgi:large subunit ribosomal protein L24